MRIIASPQDPERVAALERTVQALRTKIQDMKARLQTLENAPVRKAIPQASASTAAARPVTEASPLNADAIKKNLLAKMWKYLNDDDRPAKAA